jgi:hypothetical protein
MAQKRLAMENKLKINSCSQSWENMMPTACGRFCSACQKEIIDFRQMEMPEIINIHQKTTGRVCGIYKLGQVDIMKRISPKPISMKRWRAWYLGLLGILLAETTEGQSTIDSTKIEQLEVDKEGIRIGNELHSYHGGVVEKRSKSEEKITISGTIMDEDAEPLIGASVLVQNTRIGTIADIDGYFELVVDSSLFQNEALVLIFSYTGFTNKQLLIQHKENTVLKNLKVEMEFYTLGYPGEERWGRRMWYKVEHFFRFEWLKKD